MTPRQRAFCRPFPAGWYPRAGDVVFVRRVDFGIVVARAEVLSMRRRWKGFATVLFRYGRYSREMPWSIEDMRPCHDRTSAQMAMEALRAS